MQIGQTGEAGIFRRARDHAIPAAVALGLLTAPAWLGASTPQALDLLALGDAPLPQPVEEAALNFPGSAFFFAADAFTPSSDVNMPQSQHVLPLHKAEAAPALAFAGGGAIDRYRALNCLTTAIYYEAANEPDDGQRAVAQVILNRVRHPAWPNSVCAVIYEGTQRTDLRCQFTFSCDGSMSRRPVADKWRRARAAAQRALDGDVYAPVGLATYYHALSVRPAWASTFDSVAVVGAHIFYTMRGQQGRPAAFRVTYSGHEPDIGPSVNAYVRPQLAVSTLPEPALPSAIGSTGGRAPAALSPASPFTPLDAPAAQGWSAPPAPVAQPQSGNRLPDSTVKPEYRNSGRPLI